MSTVSTLLEIGNDLVTSTVCVVVETILITAYGAMVIKAITILVGIRHQSHTPRKIPIVTLVVVILMYIMCLALWVIDLVILIGETRMTLIKDPDVDLEVKYGRAIDFMTPRIAAIDAIYAYLTFLGDCVIIWRVYAFWAPGNWKLAMILPILLLLTSLASSMMLTYCVARLGGQILLGAYRDPAFCRNIQVISYAAPAATTAVATILIGIKAMSYFKISRAIRDKRLSRVSKAERVVVLLLESGLAYFLFFLAQVVGAIPSINDAIDARPSLQFAMRVFAYQTSCIVGMYPTIIICLVHTRRSTIDSTLHSSSYHSSIRNHKTPITLDGFRTAPESSAASGRHDVESRDDVDMQMIKTST